MLGEDASEPRSVSTRSAVIVRRGEDESRDEGMFRAFGGMTDKWVAKRRKVGGDFGAVPPVDRWIVGAEWIREYVYRGERRTVGRLVGRQRARTPPYSLMKLIEGKRPPPPPPPPPPLPIQY